MVCVGTRKAERCTSLSEAKGEYREPGAKAHSHACSKIPSGILLKAKALHSKFKKPDVCICRYPPVHYIIFFRVRYFQRNPNIDLIWKDIQKGY